MALFGKVIDTFEEKGKGFWYLIQNDYVYLIKREKLTFHTCDSLRDAEKKFYNIKAILREENQIA